MQEEKVVVQKAKQIAEKRIETKGKGERERYTQLNAEFQRIARREKKSFFNEQCKEVEENRHGKTRDLFKKIGDIKGIFHARMDTITEAEETKRTWQEYTEELFKKGLNDLDNQDDVVTHLELDIMEYKVRWPLESITTDRASEGDGTSAELFRILKDDAVRVLHSICQQF